MIVSLERRIATQRKIDTVAELRERIERSVIAIAADYSGLSVPDMGKLRSALRDAEATELRVIKNRLFLRAAKELDRPELAELLTGPTAIIFGYEDVTAPARAAAEYIKSARNTFAIRNAVMDGQVLSEADVKSLAELPPRPILVGQIAGALQAPVRNLVGLFNNILNVPPGRLLNDSVQTFAGLLDARAKQLEGA